MINKSKMLVTLVTIILIILSIANSVFATTTQVIDTTRKGSVSLTAYEFVNGNESNKRVLQGAEFTIYKVTKDITTIADAQTYITNNTSAKVNTQVSASNGLVTFSNLNLGRYFVVETNAPRNVYTKVESFLVDVPSVNSTGKEWNYNIQVNPKNVTIYADATLTKTNENGQAMQNVIFDLEKYVNGRWESYDIPLDLITNAQGKTTVHNLEAGRYRFVENESLEGYIVDKTNVQEFEVTLNDTNFTPQMSNEKVTISNYVKLDNGNYGKHIGAYTKDLVGWKVKTSVPSIIAKMQTYEITAEADEGLQFIKDSVQIYGIRGTNKTLLVSSNYSVDISGKKMKVNFNNSTLSNFDELEVLYNTSINESLISYGTANKNKVSIKYTDKINNNGTEARTYTTTPDSNAIAEVHTGKVLIYKTDGTQKLAGAKFKIATSKQNAMNGTYVTDKNGNPIEETSDSNGYVIFRGLKYGGNDDTAEAGQTTYWIVETESPTYLNQRGETEHYHLLDEPVSVTVSANSGTFVRGTTVEVVNRKGFLLPKTGAIGLAVFTAVGTAAISTGVILGKKKKQDEE